MLEIIRQLPRQELEVELRRHAHYWYLGQKTGICQVLGNNLLYVDTSDFALAPHVIRDGFWEIWVTQAMARCICDGMVAVDVGANLGYYTLLMAEAVGTKGHVFSFEPNPNLTKLMQQSISVNGYGDRVSIDPRPASDRSNQTVRLCIPAGRPMNASLFLDNSANDEKVAVQTVRLDETLPAKVDFIKIDVEGAERQVWQGLKRTLDTNPQIQLFLEFNSARAHIDNADFIDEIVGQGFKLAYVDERGDISACDRAFALSQGNVDVILHLQR